MKFKYSILYVKDVPQTLTFYKAAFGMETRFLHEGKDYGELETGQTTLAFAALDLMTQMGKSPAKADAGHPVFELAFETDDVTAALEQALTAGAILVQEPKQQPWGQTIAYVSDANGFLIEICTPVGA